MQGRPGGVYSRSEGCGMPTRYILALMGHLGIAVAYTLRVNLSVALVAMVNSTWANAHSSAKLDPECRRGKNSSSVGNDGEFKWDQHTQGVILGAFFYGYLTTQLPGGVLGNKYGGKMVFGYGVLVTSLLSLATPIVARTSYVLFIALRVIEGIGEGVTFPAMHCLLGKWAPPLERSKLAVIVYSGSASGTVLALPLSGIMCNSNFLGGWPSVFYVFGCVGILWFVAWLFLVYSSPADHPRISPTEYKYISQRMGEVRYRKQYLCAVFCSCLQLDVVGTVLGYGFFQVLVELSPIPAPPWKKIFTSPPVYAIIVGNFCYTWGFYTALTSLPSYFKEVLNFSIQENGFLSAVPFLIGFVCQIFSGYLADLLRSRRYLSTRATRKLISSIGFFLPAGFSIATSYMGCSQIYWAVALMTFTVGLNGFNLAGFGSNHLDLASNYAGVLMGISNTVGTIPGFLGPAVVGLFTQDKPTRGQWQKVLFVSAAVSFFGGIFYLIFAKGEEQEWNKANPSDLPTNRDIKDLVEEDEGETSPFIDSQ